jgi:hypothetical protein
MANPLRRGESSSQVTTWAQNDTYTDKGFTSSILPFGLQLRQTINAGTTSVTIPNGITWVYAICVGAGGGGFFGYGGSSGEISWGWTLANLACIVGTANGGYTRYGHILARGAVGANTNYFGQPAGASFGDNNPQNGGVGANAGLGGGAAAGTAQGGNGGNGISGGSGGIGNASTGTSQGGNGGSGLTGGGGGGGGGTTTGTRIGGNGGTGINIFTGAITTGGTGGTGTGTNSGGGGGGGVAGNGANASGATGGNGGLGGGAGGQNSALGGNGILYLFY